MINLIEEYKLGLPCMLGESVGRIVGESEIGSWGVINGKKYFSVPEFATPHGTVIKTGLFSLQDISEEGMKRLELHEAELNQLGKETYAGKLKNVQL